MPSSAILTAVTEQSRVPAKPPAVLKLPRLLSSLYDPRYKEMSEEEFGRVCLDIFEHRLSISREEAAYLEESTRLQSQSQLWFKHRVGRITASKFAPVSKARRDPPPLSLIKEIMGESHLDSSRVPALDWGIKNEAVAREAYLQKAKEVHISLNYQPAGLHVDTQYPHLGASPDGLIDCECCGAGLIEIKCPFKYRQWDLTEIDDRSFCLQLSEGGQLTLSHSHAYYIQIQGQLTLCKKMYCDFIVWTLCSMHIERIDHDPSVFKTIKPTLDNFFQVAILPQLLRGKEVQCDKENDPPNVASGTSTYCLCKGPEQGKMIACDNHSCAVEWFHFSCVGLHRKPRGKWYCSDSCKVQATISMH